MTTPFHFVLTPDSLLAPPRQLASSPCQQSVHNFGRQPCTITHIRLRRINLPSLFACTFCARAPGIPMNRCTVQPHWATWRAGGEADAAADDTTLPHSDYKLGLHAVMRCVRKKEERGPMWAACSSKKAARIMQMDVPRVSQSGLSAARQLRLLSCRQKDASLRAEPPHAPVRRPQPCVRAHGSASSISGSVHRAGAGACVAAAEACHSHTRQPGGRRACFLGSSAFGMTACTPRLPSTCRAGGRGGGTNGRLGREPCKATSRL